MSRIAAIQAEQAKGASLVDISDSQQRIAANSGSSLEGAASMIDKKFNIMDAIDCVAEAVKKGSDDLCFSLDRIFSDFDGETIEKLAYHATGGVLRALEGGEVMLGRKPLPDRFCELLAQSIETLERETKPKTSDKPAFHSYEDLLNAPDVEFAIENFLQKDCVTLLGSFASRNEDLGITRDVQISAHWRTVVQSVPCRRAGIACYSSILRQSLRYRLWRRD